MSYKIDVYRMEDFEVTGDKSHKSISGGVATHSYNFIESIEAKDSEAVIEYIKRSTGYTPYIFEDRLEVQESDSVSYSFYITKIEPNLLNDELKNLFPNLEEN